MHIFIIAFQKLLLQLLLNRGFSTSINDNMICCTLQMVAFKFSDHIIKCRNYNVSSGYRAVNLVTTLPFIYKLVLAPIINQRFLSVIDRQMIYCPNMKRMIDFPYWSTQWLIDDEPYIPIMSKLHLNNSLVYPFINKW